MRMQDVLAAVPGLEKRFVHYLEGQGYIRPTKLQKARIARRDYTPSDLARIRAIWGYYRRGISIQRGYELVTRTPADGAYVFFPAPSTLWRGAISLLQAVDNVTEVSAVYGESADLVVHMRAPHESDVYAVLDSLFEASIISGLPQVLRHAADVTWTSNAEPDAASEENPVIRAWVLIKVPAKQIGGLVEELRGFPGIVEAAGIYGETDVIAKIEVEDHRALDALVVERIQGLDVVESTRTFIGIGGLYWQRAS
jgi:DNA-binding transcriptional MerR regulator